MDKKKVTSNLLWKLLEKFGAQGVTLIVSIILARLLDPVVYGTIAIVTVITTLLQVFIDSGLGVSLIQKKDSDDLDFSTVFYFNFLVCIVLYVGLFFVSPLIANFYEIEELTPIIRVLGLTLIISGVRGIQQSYVSKHLMFKKFFFSTFGGTIISGVIGIWMAYNGYGVWSLVFQTLSNQFIGTVILWFTVKWRPKLQFSFTRLKRLFSYGWKLLLSSLLDTLWRDLSQIIIGKKYTTEDLAFYNKGKQFPQLATDALNGSIDSILLPTMSEVQDNPERVKSMTRRSIKMSSFLLWPMMIGLAACAEPFIDFLLTDKWLFAVPFMQIFCIVYAFYPIHTANLNAIKAMGRSDLFLILEIIKKSVSLILILSSMWFGVLAMALSSLVGSLCSQIINSWPNKKLLNYSYLEQIKDILPSLLIALIMGGVVYCVNFLKLTNWLTLLIQVPVGVIIYVLLSWIFKVETFTYCINLVKSFLRKRKEVNVND